MKSYKVVIVFVVVIATLLTGCSFQKEKLPTPTRIVFLGGSQVDGQNVELNIWWNISKNTARIDGPQLPYKNKDYDMHSFLVVEFIDGSQIAMPIEKVKVHTEGQRVIISFEDFYIVDEKQFSAFEITCDELCYFSKPFSR